MPEVAVIPTPPTTPFLYSVRVRTRLRSCFVGRGMYTQAHERTHTHHTNTEIPTAAIMTQMTFVSSLILLILPLVIIIMIFSPNNIGVVRVRLQAYPSLPCV